MPKRIDYHRRKTEFVGGTMAAPEPRTQLTVAQRAQAAALGFTAEQYRDYLLVAKAAEDEKRVRGPRLEVDDDEFGALVECVALISKFMPMLDEVGASHRQPADYLRLREVLADLQARSPLRYGKGTAVTELLGILDATGG